MKNFSIYIAFLVGLSSSSAQTKKSPANSFHLSINISSARVLSDSMEITFWRNQSFTRSIYDGGYFTFPLNRQSFEVDIDSVLHIGRLTIYSKEISAYLPHDQIVEPGDSITMTVRVRENGTADIDFSGHGSLKYNIGKKLEPLSSAMKSLEWQPQQIIDRLHVVKKYDSLLAEVMKLLNEFRHQLKKPIYDVWKADATGETWNHQLRVLSLAFSEADQLKKNEWKNLITQLLSKSSDINEQIIGLSPGYLDFEYQKTKWQLVYEKNNDYKPWEFTSSNSSFEFIDLYRKLKKSHSGLLRENLLTYSICNSSDINLFFDGCMPEDLTWCYEDAINLIKTPSLKHFAEHRLQKFGLGAPAFNFELLSQSGERVKLSDFKGRFVLLDIWSNGCTACLYFIKEFEKKVYPHIKNRSDVVALSVSTESNHDKWLNALEKHSRSFILNCFSEKGLNDDLMKHYEISYVPFVLLIDKEGKVISSSVRNCENLNKLLDSLPQ